VRVRDVQTTVQITHKSRRSEWNCEFSHVSPFTFEVYSTSYRLILRFKGKGKVVPATNQAPRREDLRVTGCTAPWNPQRRHHMKASGQPHALEQEPPPPSIGQEAGQAPEPARSRRRKKILYHSLRREENSGRPDRSPTSTPTELSRLLMPIYCGIATRIINHGTRCRWLVSFPPRPLYPRYAMDWRLSGHHNWSGRTGEEKKYRHFL
jgi:hypothetical protein